MIATRAGVRSGQPRFIVTRIESPSTTTSSTWPREMTTDEIVADFPELTPELVRAAIEFAALRERRLATA